MPPLKICITDCDHPHIDEERAVAQRAGYDLELHRAGTEDEVIAACAGADALLVQYAPITARVLDALPTVKAVVRYGVGVDTVDLRAAAERGVAVCNVPDYGVEEVSDHAIALALSAARGTAVLDRAVRDGGWDCHLGGPRYRIADRVFGVVGFGRIGRATARKARGLGYRVLAHDPLFEAGATAEDGTELVALDELFATAQVISLHLPYIPETHHLVDEVALKAMRQDAILVNTARGGVVDSAALAAALESGEIAAAGLDVFEAEPLAADNPLRTAPNCVLTPHASWYSEESFATLKRRTAEHAVTVLGGALPADTVNRAELDANGGIRRA